MIYKSSRDGFTARDFHSRCDSFGPTLTIFKTKHGLCLAGYTSVPWTTIYSTEAFVSDPDAVIFNLSSSLSFPVK